MAVSARACSLADMRTPPRVMPALITPFDDDGEIDLDSHRANLATLAGRGIGGFLIGGSTGEGPYLEPGERERLLAAARAELGSGPFLIGGIAAESRRIAAWQVDEVAEGGADAALVLTPTSLIRNNHGAVADFYRELSADMAVPVFLYSVPRVTGYELPIEQAAELASVANVRGMKDSGGQPVRMQQIMQTAPDDFAVFGGNSAALSLSVAAGARGGITASTNYAPSLVSEVVSAVDKGLDRAAEPQERLTGIARLVEARGIPGVKLAAEVSGLRPGRCRAPLRALPSGDEQQLRRSLGALRRHVLG